MKNIDDLIENSNQPDLEALNDAARGFKPNTVVSSSENDYGVTLAYDFEGNFVGVSDQREDHLFNHLIEVADRPIESYAVCQMYDSGNPQIWFLDGEEAYWVNDYELNDSDFTPEGLVGLDMSSIDEVIEDYKSAKRAEF